MSFNFKFDADGVTLSPQKEATGLLKRFLPGPKSLSLSELSIKDRDLLFAIADLRSVAESHPGSLRIDDFSIWMTHNLASELDSHTADTLGLPPLVDLIFKTDVEGVPGQDQFRLKHEWLRLGEKQIVSRTGAIINTSEGLRCLPRWLLDAVKVSESFKAVGDLYSHWDALARFRQALEPDFKISDSSDLT